MEKKREYCIKIKKRLKKFDFLDKIKDHKTPSKRMFTALKIRN